MRRIIRVLPDPENLAFAAAGEFARAASKARGPFHLALSGGSTPKNFLSKLSLEPLRSRVPWEKIHFYWGDERCVPINHSESNYAMATDALLSHVPILKEHIHRVPTEFPPDEAAIQYQKILELCLGPKPVFDFIFLGMGIDGHTASLFPGESALTDKGHTVVSVRNSSQNTARVSLAVPIFNAAKKVVFVVSGADKAEMARTVLEEPASATYPASLIVPEAGELIWLLDVGAASLLKQR